MKCNVANGWCPCLNKDMLIECRRVAQIRYYDDKGKVAFIKNCGHRLRMNRLQRAFNKEMQDKDATAHDAMTKQWYRERKSIQN